MDVGVDEAGKGPVLGSMFVAAVRAPRGAIPADIDDSKRLAASRRERLAERLREDDRVAVGVAEFTAARIDDGDANLNDLTVAGHAEALAAVARPGDDVRCDAGDVDADRFARRVGERVDAGVSITASHGADATDDLVAAASVLAKSARERHVAVLEERFGDVADVGSGYPGDPTTRAFLEAYVQERGDLPPCARRSWSTCDDVLATVAQSGLDEFQRR